MTRNAALEAAMSNLSASSFIAANKNMMFQFGASLPYKSGPLFASMSLDFSVSVIPCKLAQDKMAHLEIRNPTRRCGDSLVIGNLGFLIAAGGFLALRSPYGCGKGDLPCL